MTISRAARITGINFDVTDDRQTAIEIRELAEHTETVLDNIVDGIITIDLQGKSCRSMPLPKPSSAITNPKWPGSISVCCCRVARPSTWQG